MSEVVLEAAPRRLSPAGRHPSAVVVGQVSRRAGRSGALWGLVFAVYIAAQTLAYTSAYPTQVSRDQLSRVFGANVGINALIGPARAINTVAGYASWRSVGILSLLGALWGLLTSTRLMRGEEEAGRTELLLVGQTTRRHGAAQSLVGLGVGVAVLFAMVSVGAVLTGLDSAVRFGVDQSLYFAVTMVVAAAEFMAIGALTSQLADTRRRAASIAGVVFGVAYALRMVADSDPSLHGLVWASPLGWIEESRPLVGPNPLALVPAVVLIVAAAGFTVHLAGRRDLGASTLADRDTASPHLALLGRPIGLGLRLMRPVAVGWLVAVVAFAGLIGSIAHSAAKAVSGSNVIEQALQRLGGHGSLVSAYLGLTFVMVALLIALIAAGQITAIRSEEADGRLENLVVRPVSRTSWFAGRLVLSALLLGLAGMAAGVAAWAGAASQHSGVDFGSLLGAGVNVVAPALFVLGLGALVFGVWPRQSATVVYGYLAWSFLVEFIGAVVHASHWLLDTSVFFHVAPAPATTPDWASAAIIAGIGLAGAVLGAVGLNRRDLLGV